MTTYRSEELAQSGWCWILVVYVLWAWLKSSTLNILYAEDSTVIREGLREHLILFLEGCSLAN